MEPALIVKGVSKVFRLPHERRASVKSILINMFKKSRFEEQRALNGVSFEVQKGDFFAIVGRNGSGKSTLLKLLAGIYSPTTGDIQVNGKLTPFIELGVGFNQELTGRENVFLNGALLGFNRKEMLAMYDDIVAFAELGRFMDQKLKNYSSGMQVRLAFSIAIRARSDILLLDEVLAVGDAAFQQKCYDYFEELKREHKTVVFVSHDMGAVRRFCNRAVYIDKGKLTHQGTAEEIADVYTADNLEVAERAAAQKEGRKVSSYGVATKIAKQTAGSVQVKVTYKSKDKTEMYVGFALMKDGTSIAEIITPPDMHIKGNGALTYTLDTTALNGGVYQVDVAMFRKQNRELVSFSTVKSKFTLEHTDPTKGAALKLADTWKQA